MGDHTDPELDVRVQSSEGGATVLAFAGELDLSNAEEARSALVEAQGTANAVFLDLRALRFLDSSGLRVLLEANRRAAEGGGSLKVAAGEGVVSRVFELSGVGALLDLVDAPPGEAA
jgi:anti-sigma B factor antagonist